MMRRSQGGGRSGRHLVERRPSCVAEDDRPSGMSSDNVVGHPTDLPEQKVCPHCGKTCKAKGIASHLRACKRKEDEVSGEKVKEVGGLVSDEEKRLLQCAACGKKFGRLDALRRHKRQYCHFSASAAGAQTA